MYVHIRLAPLQSSDRHVLLHEACQLGCACRMTFCLLQLTRQPRAWMLSNPNKPARYLGLSELAECTLGKPMNKAHQTSDWEKRPLSAGQLRYAAIDAHAGMRILEHIWSNITCAEKRYLKKKGQQDPN